MSTIQKYTHDLTAACSYLNGEVLTKPLIIGWKEFLKASYAPNSVNTILAALNGLLVFCGWHDLKVKALKIQKSMFCDESKELTREEYIRLVRAAEQHSNERLPLLLQTICATGIRVSELKSITVEAVSCEWYVNTVKAILTNVKYKGDVIHPQTYKSLIVIKMSAIIYTINSGFFFCAVTNDNF